MLLIDAGLVPLGSEQGNELGLGITSGGSTTVGRLIFQRAGNLGIVVEEPFHIVGRLGEIEAAPLGIAKHLGHLVVAGDDHETAVFLSIKHVIGRSRRRGATRHAAVLDLRQLFALHQLLSLLKCLSFCYLSCLHAQAEEEAD